MRLIIISVLCLLTVAPAVAGDSKLFEMVYTESGWTYRRPTAAFFEKLNEGCRTEKNVTRYMNCLGLVEDVRSLAGGAFGPVNYGRFIAITRALLMAYPKLRLLVFPDI